MKKLVVAAGAAAFLAITSVAAFADQASGTIASVDTKNGSVTLADGKKYMLPQSVSASSLQVGDVVAVTYMSDPGTGLMLASAVVIQVTDPKT